MEEDWDHDEVELPPQQRRDAPVLWPSLKVGALAGESVPFQASHALVLAMLDRYNRTYQSICLHCLFGISCHCAS